ncbi:hypothetical protein [Actinokineospora spheciospongiae]|uniref:hypothetical protein n=1 Tax=Actinokineospora spheciospongiae TaxID=909613 RepID=UPI000D96E7A0|nr:hypothetical protein [Actinokineospora spheciospongiae]PWW50263.1 hypothetical protein DFQ13_12325 [Actinokineospora spheciospongiae]
MGSIQKAAEELAAALRQVPGVRVYTEAGAVPDPPAVLIGPPRLRWETQAPDLAPTSATFPVWLVVTLDDRALYRLWDLVPAVALALDEHAAATVVEATPDVYHGDLPAYLLTVEVGL